MTNRTKVYVLESKGLWLKEGDDFVSIIREETAKLVRSFGDAIERQICYGDVIKFSRIQIEFSVEQSGMDFKIVMRCFGLPSTPIFAGGAGTPPPTPPRKDRRVRSKRR